MFRKDFHRYFGLFLTLALITATFSAVPVHAAGPWYVATTGSNGNDCLSPGTPCATINGAIGKAASSGDTIKVAIGAYTGSGTEVVNISKSLTLSGGWNASFTTQSGTSTIDGGGTRRAVTVKGSVSSVTAALERFIIQNGYSSDVGGGIYNFADFLTVNNSTVSGNSASSGGGIYNYMGSLTLTNSTVNGNSASNSGGGIYSSGTMTLNNSTISGNSASSGGGIYNYLASGSVTLNNSTVSGNSASNSGGGIYNQDTLTLQNSLLAKNVAANSPDCFGSISSPGYNLIGNNSGCTFTAAIGDIVGTSLNPIMPLLTPLQDNGGSTLTQALMIGSPAMDAGNPATPGSGGNACLGTDQRGVARPVGAKCDIGAYEGAVPLVLASLIDDPSFEAYSPNPYWTEYSANVGTPLCTVADCGNGGGTAGPHTGSVWAWFGGLPVDESASLSQNVYFPTGYPSLKLKFYLWIGSAAAGSDINDVFIVTVDNVPVFSSNAAQKNSYPTYTQVLADVSAFADGGWHTLTFSSNTTGQLVTFNLDDVTLFNSPVVSGNVGVGGVTLSYTDGTPKTTTSLANGSYSFSVSDNWSGAVTPTHPCFTFTPASKNYNGVISNQTGQNYTPTFNAGAGCVDVNAYVSGALQGQFGLPSHGSMRASFAGVNNGPVQLVSAFNNLSILGAERVIYKVNNVNTSFSEMMGLPNSQLTTTYWLPWYNNVDLDTQLRIGNVSGNPAQVHVLIAGQEVTGSPFNLTASGNGQSLRLSFAGVNSGPVQLVADHTIVAAERVIYKVNGTNTSFSEMMALPSSQLTTTYWLPWYNNVDLDTQLRIGNVSGNPAQVHVLIAGQEVTGSPFALTASGTGQSVRLSFPSINSGPVQIVSDQTIVVAERVIYKVNGTNTSFSEMMALPNSQLNTTYWLPWYNNVDLDTQLRIGNVSGSTAHVHVFIGGVEMAGSPFALTASGTGQSVRLSFPSINSGPVQIVSDQTIVVAERVIYKVNGTNTSFSEMMALPNSQLNTTYWLPWYNNVDLDTQLRFGTP